VSICTPLIFFFPFHITPPHHITQLQHHHTTANPVDVCIHTHTYIDIHFDSSGTPTTTTTTPNMVKTKTPTIMIAKTPNKLLEFLLLSWMLVSFHGRPTRRHVL
jgi:hypothetical protein